jgi:alpha-1,2-mannosyltransferase
MIGVGRWRTFGERVVYFVAIAGVLFSPLVLIRANGWHPWGYSANSALVAPVYIDLTARLGNLADLHLLGDIYANFQFEAFTYPPSAIAFFYPLQWMSYWVAVSLWTCASVLALVGYLYIVITKTFPRKTFLPRIGTASLMALAGMTTMPSIYECLSLGQTGLILGILVAIDYFEFSSLPKGYLTGLATAVKIYPVVFLLVWAIKGDWAATRRGLLTTGCALLLSWMLWPVSFSAYFHRLLLGGAEVRLLNGGLKVFANSSFIAPLLRTPLVSAPIPSWLQILLLLIAMTVGLTLCKRLSTTRPLTTFILLSLTATGCSFVTWDHYLCFLVALPLSFVEWPERWARWVIGAVSTMMVVPFWRMRYVGGHTWTASLERLVGANGTLVATISLFAIGWIVALRRTSATELTSAAVDER